MNRSNHFSSQGAHYFFMLVLFLLSLTLQICLLHDGHNWGGDFSQYIAQAISVVDGTIESQINNNTFIIDHCDGVYGPYVYPWGYPLLLAPMYAIFGFNLIAFKMVNVILFSLFCVVFYLFCLRYMRYKNAFITTLFFALNPLFLNFANNIMSDIPFLFFSFLAFFFLSKLFDTNRYLESGINSAKIKHSCVRESHMIFTANWGGGGGDSNKKLKNSNTTSYKLALYAIFGGFFMFCAFLTRSNGIVLLLALVCMHCLYLFKTLFPHAFLSRKILSQLHIQGNLFIHLVPYFVFGFLILIFTYSFYSVGGEGYDSGLFDNMSLKRIIVNILYYTGIFSDFFAFPDFLKIESKYAYLIPNPLGFIAFVITLLFLYKSLKIFWQKDLFSLIFCLGSLVILILWPYIQGIRFCFPILPFLVLYTSLGIQVKLQNNILQKYAKTRIIVPCFIALNIVYFLLYNVNNAGKNLYSWQNPKSPIAQVLQGAYNNEAMAAYKFIKAYTPQNSVIIFFKPRVLYLNTNRLSYATHDSTDTQAAQYLLDYAGGPLFEIPKSFKLLYESEHFRFYAIQ